MSKYKLKALKITPKTAPYFFILPTILLFLAFTVYPVIDSFIMSFQTEDKGEMSFVGLDNYIRLFNDDLFYKSLYNTFVLLIIQVPVMITLAIVLAVLLNTALIKLKGIFRTTIFLPSVTSLVAASVIFMLMLNTDNGIVNYFLTKIGIDPVEWLSDSVWAKVSIMIVMTWRWTGYNMVILLSGLQGIPTDLYESASIDGAGKIKQFFFITIPQLKPIILFSVVLSTIGTLQLFDEPFILTNGGPDNSTLTVIMYLYKNGFEYFDYGYASAIAYVLVIIIAILSYFQMKVGGEKND